MARMSIDDKFLRDPRVTQLALELRVSRWEAMGRLLAVFAVCYDLERDVIPATQVDLAAERPGFADALFVVDLAVNTRRGMRIRGAGKRIEYLTPKREAGRQGGIKSGESRRNSAKQKRADREARLNPPDPVPDLPPDPVPDLIPDPPPAYAIPPSPEPVPTGVPTTPVAAAPAPMGPDQIAAHREARRLVQLELRTELERERRAVAAELGVTDHGLLAQDPGERELAMHLVNAGPAGLAAARGQALHAIAMAGLETRAQPSKFKWLTGAIFAERNFRRLVAMTAEDARAKVGSPTTSKAGKAGKKQDTPRRPDPSPEELAESAAIARAALARGFSLADGARAPPASAGPKSTDEQQPQPASKPA